VNKNKSMEAARKAVEKGQVDKAIKEYQKIVKDDPGDVRIWLKIGDLQARQGAKSEANETYQKVANFYIEQGFYRKAVAVYKQILKLDPGLIEMNLKLAELYRQLGLLSDAMQHFEMVAAFFHREGKTTEALQTIKQLVELDPENVATRIKLAELYSREKMAAEAIDEFQKACDFLRKNNRLDDFVKVAERLLWHKPEDLQLTRELASMYIRRNDAKRALQKLQVCFKADPQEVETLTLLAEAFQALGQQGKTVSVLKELARVFEQRGDRSQAEAVHRRVLEVTPEDPEAREYLGMTAPKQRAITATPAQAVFTAPPRMARPTGSMPLVQTPSPAFLDDSPELSAEAAAIDARSLGEDTLTSDTMNVVKAPGNEEIVKLLAEIEVYQKYNLHQKVVGHLRRILELDPTHKDARIKLKNTFLAQRREPDAIRELLILAEQNRGEAKTFLTEIFGIDGTCAEAHALAKKLSIDFSDPTSSQEVELLDPDDIEEIDENELEMEAEAADATMAGPPSAEFELNSNPLGDDYELPTSGDLPFDQADAKAFDAEPGMDSPAPAEDLPFDPNEARAFDAGLPESEHTEADMADVPSIGSELEEAEFFASQGMVDEAREILEGLLQTRPGDPTVMSKLREIDSLVEREDSSDNVAMATPAPQHGQKPAVMLEQSIDDGDAATHFDLGLAYKEMGILGEAIKAFQKAMSSPARVAQCHLLIGLCHREQGNLSEAINQFKAGLYVSSMGEEEKFSLYYEIASSYEALSDPQEALYYYELVHKKDPEYRDVSTSVGRLRAKGVTRGGSTSTSV
jgi:tetratricopeptide (TPR) repeat protein